MNGKYIAIAIGALLYLGVIWFADPILVAIVAWSALFLLGIPAAAISLIILFFVIGTGRSRRPPLLVLGCAALFAVLVGVSMPLNRIVQERAVVAAKAYPQQVAPLLEAYREAHGRYPNSLTELESAPRLPRLLRRWGYRSDGQTYSFSFAQPGGLIDSWDYDSQTGTWHLST